MIIISIISLIWFSVYALLIGYYHKAWNSIPENQVMNAEIPIPKISIIIAARNEQDHILRCLDSLSQQTYPKTQYQVIVVDDHSTDRTWEAISTRPEGPMELLCLRLSEFTKEPGATAYKKFAIESAISRSTGELVITTDADCSFPPEWLKTMAGFYNSTGAKFIAAPVKINNTNSFLSLFQTLDFITLQGITGGAVFKKKHSMCNGANLAYEKKVFEELGGFRGIDHIPSGDDMLFMHKVYKKYPDRVFFLKDKKAIVSTQAEQTWKGFVNQRIRWASKADKYEDKRIILVLVWVYLLNALFLGLVVLSFWNTAYLLLFVLLLLLKTIIEYPFVQSAARFFDQQPLMVYFPFLQPFHILYTLIIGWLGKFGTYRWKGRKIS